MIKYYESSSMDEKRTVVSCLYEATVLCAESDYRGAGMALKNANSLLGPDEKLKGIITEIESFNFKKAEKGIRELSRFAIKNLKPSK